MRKPKFDINIEASNHAYTWLTRPKIDHSIDLRARAVNLTLRWGFARVILRVWPA